MSGPWIHSPFWSRTGLLRPRYPDDKADGRDLGSEPDSLEQEGFVLTGTSSWRSPRMKRVRNTTAPSAAPGSPRAC
jgi:hypothetical protein